MPGPVEHILSMLNIKKRDGPAMPGDIPGEQMQQQMQGPPDPYADLESPEAKKKTVELVNREFKRRLEDRLPFELQWRHNIAMLEGHQYLTPNYYVGSLVEEPLLYWYEQRRVYNHIAPNIEVRIARQQKAIQLPKVKPGGNEQQDVKTAKISDQLIKEVFYDQQIKRKMASIFHWCEATGTVLLKNTWDKEAGAPLEYLNRDPETGLEMPAEAREGDLDATVCPSFEVLPDSPLNADVADVQSMIHSRLYHIDAVKSIWNIDVAPEKTDIIRVMSGTAGAGQLGSIYGMTAQFLGNQKITDNHAIVKEWWERPSRNWPKGRFIIVIADQCVYNGPLPYRNGKNGEYSLPFSKVCCVNRADCFWGKTIVERLIPTQQSYNALRNRKSEYLTSCAIAGWIAEDNSVDFSDLEQNGGSPGYVLKVKPGAGFIPQRIQNPPLPSAFESEEQTLLANFSILSGVSEISRSSAVPAGVKSGIAMEVALEQDETRLAHTVKNFDEFLIDASEQWLRLYQQFVQGPRLLKAAGKNNIVDIMEWTGSDLNADDIMIETVPALAESPAQRRQMVMDLANMGIFAPDFDKGLRQLILETMEMGNWEMADDEEELQFAVADRENQILDQGFAPEQLLEPMLMPEPMPINSYDDDLLHIKRHNIKRLSVEYEELKAQNPSVNMAYDLHVMLHQQRLMARMAPPPVLDTGEEGEPEPPAA